MALRRRRLPAALRPPLVPGERVLAWARTAGGAVVATNLGLFLPGLASPGAAPGEAASGGTLPGGGRLGWHEIHWARWTGRELTVVPAAVAEERPGYAVVADRPAVTVPVPEPGRVPQVVQARVTRSVSLSSHHPVPGGGVRVVARRVPGIDGLRWAVRYDQGTDPHAPEVREATDRLVAAHEAAQRPPI